MLPVLLTTITVNQYLQVLPFEVVDVKITRVFAGKLGQRVHREVILRSDGGTITIRLQPYHDRFKPEPRSPRKGEVIRLSDLKA